MRAVLCLLHVAAAVCETHYDVLGVPPTAKLAEIKRAYYKLAKTVHPDKVDASKKQEAEARFKKLGAAHEVLSDAEARKQYDASLRGHTPAEARQQPSPPPPASQHRQQAKRRVRTLADAVDLLAEMDARRLLRRHLLLAFYDSRLAACTRTLFDVVEFPFPFAHYSQEWHGVWWEDILLAAVHDVAPSLRANRPSDLVQLYAAAMGGLSRGSQGLALRRCPLFVFQKEGEYLGQYTTHATKLLSAAGSADEFQRWAWSHLLVQLRVVNLLHVPIRLNWIHGGYVKEIGTIEARGTYSPQVYAGHTLQAEHTTRGGDAISENSSLLIFKVYNSSREMRVAERCVDSTSHCEFWRGEGHCESNRVFMRAECQRSCGVCDLHAARAAKKPSLPPQAEGGPSKQRDGCEDHDRNCKEWAAKDECRTNPGFMRKKCPASCGACARCEDKSADCKGWRDHGQCEQNAAFMRESCRAACGWCGLNESAICADEQLDCKLWAHDGECISNAKYMRSHCKKSCGFCGSGKGKVVAAAAACVDKHKDCTAWAEQGDCARNAEFMKVECAAACGRCGAECVDGVRDCGAWVKDQQCLRNRLFMARHCRASCGWCHQLPSQAGKDQCTDEDIKCEGWARANECHTNAGFMKEKCRRSCRFCQSQASQAAPRLTPRKEPLSEAERLAKGGKQGSASHAEQSAPRAHRTNTPSVTQPCVDHHRMCDNWAKLGECTSNEKFMKDNCLKACGACQPVITQCTDNFKDCVGMGRQDPSAKPCSTEFMRVNCRQTCGLCVSNLDAGAARSSASPASARKPPKGKDEL
ncbi:hypothetical protein AB1Y20_010899 [Prymnesium parvum]|uniref:Uncharacterized protein n=1 Tax=Prymnesium parvum TaxID=97485 RepID=A0AB34ISL8_PRYPA